MDSEITFRQMGIAEEMSHERFSRIFELVAPYSMVHKTGIMFTMAAAIYAIKHDLPGVFVECGTWRGGCSLALLLAQREVFGKVLRPVYMLDSFEGLPKVDERDGPLAVQWQSGVDPEKFLDNCKAVRSDLENLLRQHRFSAHDFKLVHGWFDSTVPAVATELLDAGISVLRLDADWYASTEIALKHLCPLVCEKGAVIVDDYYAWDGCARAVHEFLSRNNLPYRIKSLPYNFGAYFIKRASRSSFDEF